MPYYVSGYVEYHIHNNAKLSRQMYAEQRLLLCGEAAIKAKASHPLRPLRSALPEFRPRTAVDPKFLKRGVRISFVHMSGKRHGQRRTAQVLGANKAAGKATLMEADGIQRTYCIRYMRDVRFA